MFQPVQHAGYVAACHHQLVGNRFRRGVDAEPRDGVHDVELGNSEAKGLHHLGVAAVALLVGAHDGEPGGGFEFLA